MNIEIRDIDFSYEPKTNNPVKVFKSFSLSIKPGQITSIIGLSGGGKSTLLKLLCGLLTPEKGKISINNKPPTQLQKEGFFGLVFQSSDLLPWRNIIKNVLLPFELQKKNIIKSKALKLLYDLGLSGLEEKYPYQLSGGMQQRVAIARALVTSPPILLLDEPFSQLDELLRFELLLFIQDYAIKNACTVIFVTHDISEAVLVSDKVFVLDKTPVSLASSVNIEIKKPRSIETTSTDFFNSYISEVRTLLIKSKAIVSE